MAYRKQPKNKIMKPVIFGLKGKTLTAEERALFIEHKPAGFIIFKRNIESNDQLKSLLADLKSLYPEEILLLIDQEGGRVQRWIAEGSERYPAPGKISATIEEKGLAEALKYCYEINFQIASELKELGFTTNCTPVADLLFEGGDNVIGDRSFSSKPEFVVAFCKEVIRAHKDAGIEPIIKHIPGHGRATQDSHYHPPRVSSPLEELEKTDFAVFKDLAPLVNFAMTAHCIYDALDPTLPATQSKIVIDYIKDGIGFKGSIFTDAIEMDALTGNVADRSLASLDAGCNYVLHCTANIEEMEEILLTI